MEAAGARRAVDAAISTISSLDLTVDDSVVLSDSNRLVVRLTPCDIVARVTPMTHFASAEREVELVKRLTQTDSPVAALAARVEPRVFVRDGFKITMWTYFEPVQSRVLPPADYAQALERLHAGLRQIDVKSIVNRRTPEHLLHGEPHPWNVLNTKNGPLFIDFENTAEGPAEYDIAWVPKEVGERYPNADEDLAGDCRGVVLAIIATHRWSRDDQHPSGRQSGLAFLNALREGPPWPALDDVAW